MFVQHSKGDEESRSLSTDYFAKYLANFFDSLDAEVDTAKKLASKIKENIVGLGGTVGGSSENKLAAVEIIGALFVSNQLIFSSFLLPLPFPSSCFYFIYRKNC